MFSEHDKSLILKEAMKVGVDFFSILETEDGISHLCNQIQIGELGNLSQEAREDIIEQAAHLGCSRCEDDAKPWWWCCHSQKP